MFSSKTLKTIEYWDLDEVNTLKKYFKSFLYILSVKYYIIRRIKFISSIIKDSENL